jgi:hypothetical protein
MPGRRLTGIVLALTVLAVSASPAAATEVRTAAGAPYTGPLEGALASDTFTFATVSSQGQSSATVCNESAFEATLTSAGTFMAPAGGSLDQITWQKDGGECGLPLSGGGTQAGGLDPVDLPWAARIEWRSDNTAGRPNGVLTLAAPRFDFHFVAMGIGPVHFRYTGLDGTTEVSLFNPDNTDSGELEARFQVEPMECIADQSDDGCGSADNAFALGDYPLTAPGGGALQVRQGAPAATPPAPTPKKKCKRKKPKKKCKKRPRK